MLFICDWSLTKNISDCEFKLTTTPVTINNYLDWQSLAETKVIFWKFFELNLYLYITTRNSFCVGEARLVKVSETKISHSEIRSPPLGPFYSQWQRQRQSFCANHCRCRFLKMNTKPAGVWHVRYTCTCTLASHSSRWWTELPFGGGILFLEGLAALLRCRSE